ncbi:hypothetical protein EPUL_005522, partial [Erysiphe pulchra]
CLPRISRSFNGTQPTTPNSPHLPNTQYPIPNSASPFASPSQPLNLEPPSKTTDGKQILKPVAPSKRPVTERPTQKSSDKLNFGNAFLPKELAEIFAIRQRRERAWYAHLMICTIAITAAFKAYLQLAIANFVAVDSPPKIPSHSRPTRGSSHESGKDKTIGKKAAVAIPRSILGVDSSVRKAQEAIVARKGKKKAWLTLNPKAQAALVRKAANSVNSKDKLTIRASLNTATTNRRLFVRLPQEYEWRKLSPAGIREVMYRSTRDNFNARNGLFLSGAKLEAATNWIPVIVPTVTSTIRKEQGEVFVSKSMLIDEIEQVCSIRPVHVKLYGGNKAEALPRTWMAYFPRAPRAKFRVFDESGIARQFKKQQPLEFCKRCNRYHLTKNCSRESLCGNCGSTNHTEDIYMAATKCRNCGGPHRSDSRRCLARPTQSGVPTKEQMKTYRQAE